MRWLRGQLSLVAPAQLLSGGVCIHNPIFLSLTRSAIWASQQCTRHAYLCPSVRECLYVCMQRAWTSDASARGQIADGRSLPMYPRPSSRQHWQRYKPLTSRVYACRYMRIRVCTCLYVCLCYCLCVCEKNVARLTKHARPLAARCVSHGHAGAVRSGRRSGSLGGTRCRQLPCSRQPGSALLPHGACMGEPRGADLCMCVHAHVHMRMHARMHVCMYVCVCGNATALWCFGGAD
jgi:hypothetical protein